MQGKREGSSDTGLLVAAKCCDVAARNDYDTVMYDDILAKQRVHAVCYGIDGATLKLTNPLFEIPFKMLCGCGVDKAAVQKGPYQHHTHTAS